MTATTNDQLRREDKGTGQVKGAACPANSITFVLQDIPPSVNSLYQIIYSQRRVELKPECRQWKSEAKQAMPTWELIHADSPIEIQAIFYFPQRHKNQKRRIYDPANLLKLLIDAIAERYHFDDCRVLAGSWASLDSPHRQVRVTVFERLLEESTESSGELILHK